MQQRQENITICIREPCKVEMLLSGYMKHYRCVNFYFLCSFNLLGFMEQESVLCLKEAKTDVRYGFQYLTNWRKQNGVLTPNSLGSESHLDCLDSHRK